MQYPLRRFVGPVWRMLAVRFQNSPLSGEGARLYGGRWNPRGVPALYLATDPVTAVAEFYQGFAKPGTLAPYRLRADRIVDLTDGRGAPVDRSVVQALEANWKAIEAAGKASTPNWSLAESLIASGAEGALVPSAQNRGGTNLVLWRWQHAAAGVGAGAELVLLDPEQDLAK